MSVSLNYGKISTTDERKGDWRTQIHVDYTLCLDKKAAHLISGHNSSKFIPIFTVLSLSAFTKEFLIHLFSPHLKFLIFVCV